MAYIVSAFYGDEKSQKDVTKVLSDKILGTTLDIDVNEQLIPPFEVTNKVELDAKEEKKIRADAEKACGGVDQVCIDRTEATLRQDKLAEKQNQGSGQVIKGRRLTLNYIDENGKRVRKVIVDGQKFKMDNIAASDPKKSAVPSSSYIQNQFKLLGMLVLSTLVYVFSVAATYTLFMRERAGILLAGPATVIAIFIPYSGYVLMFLYYMFGGAVRTFTGEL